MESFKWKYSVEMEKDKFPVIGRINAGDEVDIHEYAKSLRRKLTFI